MKKLCGIYLAIILAGACTPKLRSYSPQVSSSPGTEPNTLFIQASGLGTDERRSYEHAIHEALSTLLFQGIPGSVQPKPIIPPDDASRMRPKVESCLSDNNCYRNFILQINQVGSYVQVKGGYSATVNCKVNLAALQNWLEQNNIIRKFGL